MRTKHKVIVFLLSLLVILTVGSYFAYQAWLKDSIVIPNQGTVDGVVYNTFSISRDDLDTELEDLQALLMSAKASPYRLPEQEKITGFQITEIQPNTFWTKFGFSDGDIITQINGTNLDGTSSPVELYTTLTSAKVTKIKFNILRNEVPGFLIVNIE